MDYYNHVGWLLVALAAIETGGGGYTGRDVDAGRDYTGRDRISIYAEQDAWRTSVRDKFDDIAERFWHLREENQRLRTQLMTALILIAALFLLGLVATALTIRELDKQWTHIERNEKSIEGIERAVERHFFVSPYPTP